MPISETFNNTVGTIVAFESGAQPKATVNGLTGVGTNDWMRSNTNSMDNSDDAFDIEFEVARWNSTMWMGVSDGRSWGTWGGCWAVYLASDGKIYVSKIGSSNYNGVNHGLTPGDSCTVRMKYESGTITAYLDGVEKTSYNVDLSGYTTMYPLLYTATEDLDLYWSYTELVPSTGISASKRSINC